MKRKEEREETERRGGDRGWEKGKEGREGVIRCVKSYNGR